MVYCAPLNPVPGTTVVPYDVRDTRDHRSYACWGRRCTGVHSSREHSHPRPPPRDSSHDGDGQTQKTALRRDSNSFKCGIHKNLPTHGTKGRLSTLTVTRLCQTLLTGQQNVKDREEKHHIQYNPPPGTSKHGAREYKNLRLRDL